MSKSKSAELIEARVAHERQWALARWTERLSFWQMRQAAGLPPSEGGLGYDLSTQALKALVEQARLDNGDLTMGKDERRERQLVEVDARARAARGDLDEAYRRKCKLDQAINALEVVTADDAKALAGLVVERGGIARELESAERRLDSAQERETKLVGLAAPVSATLDVTMHDAVTDELNAMLARAGRPPIEVRHD